MVLLRSYFCATLNLLSAKFQGQEKRFQKDCTLRSWKDPRGLSLGLFFPGTSLTLYTVLTLKFLALKKLLFSL